MGAHAFCPQPESIKSNGLGVVFGSRPPLAINADMIFFFSFFHFFFCPTRFTHASYSLRSSGTRPKYGRLAEWIARFSFFLYSRGALAAFYLIEVMCGRMLEGCRPRIIIIICCIVAMPFDNSDRLICASWRIRLQSQFDNILLMTFCN